jgi:Zn-dependent protease with chaperone function
MRDIHGSALRRYCWVGDQGEVILEDGSPAAAEQNFATKAEIAKLQAGELDDAATDDLFGRTPNEDAVMAVAAEWSTDPSCIEDRTDLAPSGLLGFVENRPQLLISGASTKIAGLMRCYNPSRMRSTILFLCRFGLVPITVWFLAGPGLFRLWVFAELVVGIYLRVRASDRFGVRQGISEAAKADSLGKQPETSDPIAAALIQLVSELGWPVVPQLAVVASVPGYDNAALTRRFDGRPVILVSRRLVGELPPEVVRAVLAHELGHMLKVNRVAQSLAQWLDFWAPLIGVVLALVASESAWGVAALVVLRSTTYLLDRAIRRSCETRADGLAVGLGCGRDAVRFLEWGLSIRKSRRMAPEWLSTHPRYESRIKRINRLASSAATAPNLT